MPQIALLAVGAACLLVPPAAAQSGLASPVQPVALSATRIPSVAVGVAADAGAPAASLSVGSAEAGLVPVTTAWTADPSAPVGIALVAVVEVPAGRPVTTSLFTQAIGTPDAHRLRTDAVRVPPGARLTLQAITQ